MLENLEVEKLKYEETSVETFEEAVNEIENQKLGGSDFCLVDIDGVLISNDLVKLPFVTHLVEPKIEECTKRAFKSLVDKFKGSVAISTNRCEEESFVFNSKRVVKDVRDLIDSCGKKIPFFSALFKQIPGLAKEDIAEEGLYIEDGLEYGEVVKARIDRLVHYIGKRVLEDDSNSLTLYSIEDLSIVSLNRERFLKYVAGRLREEYDIDVNISHYVIWKSWL
jgi:hypothetical protein